MQTGRQKGEDHRNLEGVEPLVRRHGDEGDETRPQRIPTDGRHRRPVLADLAREPEPEWHGGDLAQEIGRQVEAIQLPREQHVLHEVERQAVRHRCSQGGEQEHDDEHHVGRVAPHIAQPFPDGGAPLGGFLQGVFGHRQHGVRHEHEHHGRHAPRQEVNGVRRLGVAEEQYERRHERRNQRPGDAEALPPTEDQRAFMVSAAQFGAPSVVGEVLDGGAQIDEGDHGEQIGITPIECEPQPSDFGELPRRHEEQEDAGDVDGRSRQHPRLAAPPAGLHPVRQVADDRVRHHIREPRHHDDDAHQAQRQPKPVRIRIERRQIDGQRQPGQREWRGRCRIRGQAIERKGSGAPLPPFVGGCLGHRYQPVPNTRAKFCA